MTRDELVDRLLALGDLRLPIAETRYLAEELLLRYIADPEIRAAFQVARRKLP